MASSQHETAASGFERKATRTNRSRAVQFMRSCLIYAQPHRQRRTVRLGACALRAEQALGVVAPPGHSAGTHQAGPSAAERAARTHASDAEEGSDEARRRECPAATGALR